MAISLRAVGTPTTAAAAVTPLAPGVPAGVVAGDLSLLFVEIKATSGTVAPAVTTPSGWTLQAAAISTGNDVAAANDVGENWIFVYYRTDAGYAAPSVGSTGGNSAGAVIVAWQKDPSETWVLPTVSQSYVSGQDASSGANGSAAGSGSLAVIPGDVLVTAAGLSGDLGTITAEGVTATGLTLGTYTNHVSLAVTTGTDSRLLVSSWPVTSTATAIPTYTWTNTSSLTGVVRMLRLRVTAGTPAFTQSGVLGGEGTVTATASQGAAPNWPDLVGTFGDTAAGTITASASITLPAGINANDVGWMIVGTNSGGADISVLDGWTLVDGPYVNGANNLKAWLYKRVMSGAENGTPVDITFTSSGRWHIAGVVLRNADAVQNQLATWIDNTDDLLLSIPAITPTVDNTRLISLAASRYATTTVGVTATDGWSETGEYNTTNGTAPLFGAWAGTRLVSGGANVAQPGQDQTYAGTARTIGWVLAIPYNAPASNFTQSGTLSGSGTVTATQLFGDIESGALSGSGTVTATQRPAFALGGSLSGSGTITAVSTPAVTRAGAISSAGTITATQTRAVSLGGSLSGSGTITATQVVAFPLGGSLSGSGTISATSSAVEAKTASGVLSGSGTITGGALPSVTQPGALSGAGTVSATSSPSVTRSGALSGAGTVSAVVTPRPVQQGSLSGSGTISAAQVLAVARAGALSGTGTITGATSSAGVVSGAVSGSGTITGVTTPRATQSGVLSGLGTLSGVSVVAFVRAGTLSGAGTVSATTSTVQAQQGLLSGAGSISGVLTPRPIQSGSLSGVGTITATAGGAVTRTGVLSGSGTITAVQQLGIARTGTLSGTGTVTAVGIAARVVSGQISGVGTITAGVLAARFVVGSLEGEGTVTSEPLVLFTQTAVLSGIGTITATLESRGAFRDLIITWGQLRTGRTRISPLFTGEVSGTLRTGLVATALRTRSTTTALRTGSITAKMRS